MVSRDKSARMILLVGTNQQHDLNEDALASMHLYLLKKFLFGLIFELPLIHNQQEL